VYLHVIVCNNCYLLISAGMAPLRWLLFGTLCCLAASAISTPTLPALTNALKLKLRLANGDHVQRPFGRNLLATAPQCVWSPSSGCDLNDGYITGLSGTPASNSQKLLARFAASDHKCSTYTTKATCMANPNDFCGWDSASQECSVGPSFLKIGWLQDVVYCSGSRVGALMTCLTLSNQTACGANSNCAWSDSTQLSSNSFGSSFLEALGGWSGYAASSTTYICSAKWTTNATDVAYLVNKMLAAAANASLDTSSKSAGNFLGPVFGDLFGGCSGVTRYRDALLTCPAKTNKTSCDAAPACGWDPAMTIPACDMSDNYAMDLLLDPKDPWVIAYNNASSACAAQTTNTTCTGLATVTVDTTKYDSFSNLSPDFSSAAGMLSMSSLLMSLMAGLVCLWALLL
ncbi:hypothetical protein Agub_g10640, partial [Astrephomene gubernaculifera]